MHIRCNTPKAAPRNEWKTSQGIMIRGGNHHMNHGIYIPLSKDMLVKMGFLKAKARWSLHSVLPEPLRRCKMAVSQEEMDEIMAAAAEAAGVEDVGGPFRWTSYLQ